MDYKIRQDRTPQERKKLTAGRAAYFQLMREGYSNKEVCRIVGINPRTGKVWGNGRNAHKGRSRSAPPVRGAASTGPSRYLRESDGIHIADGLREKASLRPIAAEFGRSPSAIGREVRRNGKLYEAGGAWAYRPHAARGRADGRRPRPKQGKIGRNPELREFVQDHLERRWSPEQISRVLRLRFPDGPEMHVVHGTIYQAPTSRVWDTPAGRLAQLLDRRLITATRPPPGCASRRWEVSPPTT
ncbi:IS30 family transposase [Streptomyces bryophytorum]|uniref:Transposase IS30-like HTH domain-containing protein n=1 Tax=Actinacidiphila bryophytorum TaxID=1436133 RepID=A0A9W4H444_9ACTN|nr:helix-turn-helix domain-containing protein [Actinacidiphila bryophytorum]MBM9435786.1 IS30 family transposase [Actinacidiphila bryophytorum]MBN6541629.1 IS30 family transposase [Actinacidiphila bryophytorum]CAG7650245.1 hypothetical protein SBRY_50309 [Actinacidiphila bryophytorum]